jgi:hypothetical protein
MSSLRSSLDLVLMLKPYFPTGEINFRLRIVRDLNPSVVEPGRRLGGV